MDIYEEEMTEAQKVFDEQYSKGEYCHEQSFLWGFQEGTDFKKKELIEEAWEAFCKTLCPNGRECTGTCPLEKHFRRTLEEIMKK